MPCLRLPVEVWWALECALADVDAGLLSALTHRRLPGRLEALTRSAIVGPDALAVGPLEPQPEVSKIEKRYIEKRYIGDFGHIERERDKYAAAYSYPSHPTHPRPLQQHPPSSGTVVCTSTAPRQTAVLLSIVTKPTTNSSGRNDGSVGPHDPSPVLAKAPRANNPSLSPNGLTIPLSAQAHDLTILPLWPKPPTSPQSLSQPKPTT